MPLFIIAIGYLLGSVPTAYLAGRLKNKDIRRLGDGNVGAANVYRELGAKTGLAVFLLDAAKGAAAIFIAERFGASEMVVLFSGAAAIGGHNWPLFLHFRGGRGESTTIGALLSVITQPMLICIIPALIALLISRNVTRASAFLFVPLPLVSWWLGEPGLLISYSIGLPVLVGITHYFRTHPRHLAAA